jgi:hypothetical protein
VVEGGEGKAGGEGEEVGGEDEAIQGRGIRKVQGEEGLKDELAGECEDGGEEVSPDINGFVVDGKYGCQT